MASALNSIQSALSTVYGGAVNLGSFAYTQAGNVATAVSKLAVAGFETLKSGASAGFALVKAHPYIAAAAVVATVAAAAEKKFGLIDQAKTAYNAYMAPASDAPAPDAPAAPADEQV